MWMNAPARHIEFDDMVAKRKADLLTMNSPQSSFKDKTSRAIVETPASRRCGI
jgi:hypothetical protein